MSTRVVYRLFVINSDGHLRSPLEFHKSNGVYGLTGDFASLTAAEVAVLSYEEDQPWPQEFLALPVIIKDIHFGP